MSNKRKVDKSLKTGIIILLIVALIASSTIVIVFGTNNKLKPTDSTNTQPVGNELYMLVLPDLDPVNNTPELDPLDNIVLFAQDSNDSKILVKVLNETTSFGYMRPGSQHNFSVNDTLYVYAYILNNEPKELNCSIIAYQSEVDDVNSIFNYTQLFQGALNPIPGHSNQKVTFQVKPDHISNNSYLGIALLDGSSNTSKILNYTDIKVSII
jgi:hypothetical protein